MTAMKTPPTRATGKRWSETMAHCAMNTAVKPKIKSDTAAAVRNESCNLARPVALVFRLEPAASPVGIGLTIASLLILAALWRWQLALADRFERPALRGDAARRG
jgi:hypothetical protein